MTESKSAASASAPATGLFGGWRQAEPAGTDRGEPTATQKKSFADLFRADGSELHAA
jgi:hypothetical protein